MWISQQCSPTNPLLLFSLNQDRSNLELNAAPQLLQDTARNASLKDGKTCFLGFEFHTLDGAEGDIMKGVCLLPGFSSVMGSHVIIMRLVSIADLASDIKHIPGPLPLSDGTHMTHL